MSIHARSTPAKTISQAVLNKMKSADSDVLKHPDVNNFGRYFYLASTSPVTFESNKNENVSFMVQSMVEMSTGIRIMPVNADRMINGSHGLHNAELDKWVQFKFTEISEPLAQVWTGIPFQFMKRLEDLNEGRPVRNYALRQLAEAILENNPEFNPQLDYVYICTEDVEE